MAERRQYSASTVEWRQQRVSKELPPIQMPVGLRYWDKAKAFEGYTLFAPKHNTIIYLKKTILNCSLVERKALDE